MRVYGIVLFAFCLASIVMGIMVIAGKPPEPMGLGVVLLGDALLLGWGGYRAVGLPG